MKTAYRPLQIASILLMVVSPGLFMLTNFFLMVFAALPDLSPIGYQLAIFSTLHTPFIHLIVCIISGIWGLLALKKPRRTVRCLILGSVLLICNSIQAIVYTIGDVGGAVIVCWILNASIPVWYMAAAYQLRNVNRD